KRKKDIENYSPVLFSLSLSFFYISRIVADTACEEMARKCLICQAGITQIHMGIDACRACAVFYRRARRSKCKFRCKSSTGKCVEEGRVLECRRCRFTLMDGIFERATLEIPRATSSIPSNCTKSEPESGISSAPASVSVMGPGSEPGCSIASPATPLAPPQRPVIVAPPTRCPNAPSTSATPVLDRIRCGYNVMTRIRKSSELCMRPLDKFVHPTAIDDNTFPIIPATHGLTHRTTQILLTSMFDFASISFPEFETLSTNEKWHLIVGSYERWHIIESTFRATKIFPDDDRIFVSYTMTLSTDTVDIFLSDYTLKTNSIEEATTALRQNLEANAGRSKKAMKRADPTDEEFLVLLALSFWNTGENSEETPSGDERLSKMATASRTAIMQDLHAYYSGRNVNDYATRIGELFCLLVANERVTSLITEDIELLRLMDVYQQPRF
ncbi:hypothetical protein PENTCL1PPCAC_16036, partial [Pristionchus entomophagus]